MTSLNVPSPFAPSVFNATKSIEYGDTIYLKSVVGMAQTGTIYPVRVASVPRTAGESTFFGDLGFDLPTVSLDPVFRLRLYTNSTGRMTTPLLVQTGSVTVPSLRIGDHWQLAPSGQNLVLQQWQPTSGMYETKYTFQSTGS